MSQAFQNASVSSRSRLFGLTGLALLALWVVLVVGFVAQTVGPDQAPQGTTLQAADRCADPGAC
ncbi:MAG TPA: hypothetical protein VFG59_17545 [Anaeromyxobacter sp.]|nr:hypothetical protein [Anaeromyxobacter sp.]